MVANFLANRYNKSYDATANKRYSLSDQTAKIVRDLKQDVTIQYFDKPSGMQAGKDLLDRYANLSPKVHVEYIDYQKKPTLARAANLTHEGTAIIELGGKKEEAKTFDEEGITGALIRAIKGGARIVCVVTGSGEHRVEDYDRRRLFRFPDRRPERQLRSQDHQPARKGGSADRLHRAGGRGTRQRLHPAGCRCHQEVCREAAAAR